jgi:digeranylgeranylglycerophospholipid reductase
VRVAHFHARDRAATLSYPTPPGCILDIPALTRHLAQEARRAGAEVHLGQAARRPILEGGSVVGVETGDGPLRARLTVDAGGVGSFLGRHLGHGGFERYGLGSEALVEAPAWPADTVAFWVGAPMAPSGYAWAFPEGGGRVRVGVGLIRPDHSGSARQALEKLLESDRQELAILRGRPRLELRTGAIPSEPARVPLVGEGWITVGDAAGHASPLLGEGIRFALEMGEVAGDRAARAVRARDDQAARRALAGYARTWEERYGAKFRLEHRLNRRLARMRPESWNRAVALLGDLPGELPLELLEGRWTLPLAASLLVRHPRLGGTLLRHAVGRLLAPTARTRRTGAPVGPGSVGAVLEERSSP